MHRLKIETIRFSRNNQNATIIGTWEPIYVPRSLLPPRPRRWYVTSEHHPRPGRWMPDRVEILVFDDDLRRVDGALAEQLIEAVTAQTVINDASDVEDPQPEPTDPQAERIIEQIRRRVDGWNHAEIDLAIKRHHRSLHQADTAGRSIRDLAIAGRYAAALFSGWPEPDLRIFAGTRKDRPESADASIHELDAEVAAALGTDNIEDQLT